MGLVSNTAGGDRVLFLTKNLAAKSKLPSKFFSCICCLYNVLHKATVIFISVSRHFFPRKATLLTEKKIISPQKIIPIPSHSIWSQARRSTDFCFIAGIIHTSVSRPSQSPSLAVKCASASALECEHAPPSQSILGTQDVQTGTSMKPLPQQGGDWHCHT